MFRAAPTIPATHSGARTPWEPARTVSARLPAACESVAPSDSTARLLKGRVVVDNQPLDDGQRQAAVAEQLIVESAQAVARALLIAVAAEQAHDLPLAVQIRDLLSGFRGRTGGFACGRFAIEAARFHKVLDRLLEAPAAGVEVD